jgi:hypothetical protein
MECQAKDGCCHSAFKRFGAEQPSRDSLQSKLYCDAALPPNDKRGCDIQNTNNQTSRQDCVKRSAVIHTASLFLPVEFNGSGHIEQVDSGKPETKKLDFTWFSVFLRSRFVVISLDKWLHQSGY